MREPTRISAGPVAKTGMLAASRDISERSFKSSVKELDKFIWQY